MTTAKLTTVTATSMAFPLTNIFAPVTCKVLNKDIATPPRPIFKKKSKNKNNEADRKKRKKSLNGDGGNGSGAAVAPIFSGKGKVCFKGGTSVGALMGAPLGGGTRKNCP